MREIALFSGKIYTAGTNFTRPPAVTVATNLSSEPILSLTFVTTRKQNIPKKYLLPCGENYRHSHVFPIRRKEDKSSGS